MPTPRDTALANTTEAIRWALAAINALNAIIGYNGQRANIANLPQFKAQKTHFHVDLGPPPTVVQRFLGLLPFVEPDPTLKLLKAIRFRYFDINSALNDASHFVNAPAGGGSEHTGTSPAFVPTIRDGTLRITPYYDDLGPLCKVHCLVHEGAHFTSEAVQDYAYRDRRGEDDPMKYIKLSVQYAFDNADSYAYFALQMAKNIDRVIDSDE
jgi:hypothetical protein